MNVHRYQGYSIFGTIFILWNLLSASVHAQETIRPILAQPTDSVRVQTLDLAQNSTPNENKENNDLNKPSGTLLLPDSMTQNDDEEKKCMTVCARWGEDCTYINRGIGGMTRSCRRTCQQFTEECF